VLPEQAADCGLGNRPPGQRIEGYFHGQPCGFSAIRDPSTARPWKRRLKRDATTSRRSIAPLSSPRRSLRRATRGGARRPSNCRRLRSLRVGEVVAERGGVSAHVPTAEGVVCEVDVSDHLQDAANPREHEVRRDPVQVVDERAAGDGLRRRFGNAPSLNRVAKIGDEISLGKARVFKKRLHNRSSWKKCKGCPYKNSATRGFCRAL
jgi:hypothetical protein